MLPGRGFSSLWVFYLPYAAAFEMSPRSMREAVLANVDPAKLGTQGARLGRGEASAWSV